MKAPIPCAVCGSSDDLIVSHSGSPFPVLDMDYMAYCQGCYDGAPDAGYHPVGYGPTAEAAVADWQEMTQDLDDHDCHVCQACGRGVVTDDNECLQCGER